MFKVNTKTIAFAITSLFLMMSVSEAVTCPTCDDGYAAEIAEMASTTAAALGEAAYAAHYLLFLRLSSAIPPIHASFLNVVNAGSSSIVNAINGLSKGKVASDGKALDMVTNTHVLSSQIQTQIQVEHEHSVTGKTGVPNPAGLPNPCTTAGAGMGANVAIMGAQDISRTNNKIFLNRQLRISNSDADLLSRYKTYTSTYQTIGPRRNADIQASTLLGGTPLSATVLGDRSRRSRNGRAADVSNTPNGDYNTLNGDQIEDAKQLILNMTRQATVEDISDSAAQTAEGRRFRMMMREEQARNGIAMTSLSDALAARTPVQGLAAKLGDSWTKTADTLNAKTRPSKNDISYWDYLTTEVDRRQSNSDWYVQTAGASPENVAKDKLFIKAFGLRLRLEQLKKLEKIELLLAQSTLNAIPNSLSRQKLEEQRARVTGR